MYKVNFITDQFDNWETEFKTKKDLANFLCTITKSANPIGLSGKYIAWNGSTHETFGSPVFKLKTTELNNDEEFIDFCLTMYGRTDIYDNEDDNRPSITVNGVEGEIFNTGAGKRWEGACNVRPHDYDYVSYFSQLKASERRHTYEEGQAPKNRGVAAEK